MKFDPFSYKYPSRRTLVYGSRGMVCATQPLAAQAGLDMIKKGGSAVDAAVAAAACPPRSSPYIAAPNDIPSSSPFTNRLTASDEPCIVSAPHRN